VDLPDIIVPIPLHWKRVAERGFNQSLELARPVSAHLHLPLDSTTCVRRIPTVPQLTLEKRSRLRNIRGAFDVRRDIGARHVVLLDDVVTTGATVSELAAQLLQRGAKKVDVWALARTP
jgi:ComF family protein